MMLRLKRGKDFRSEATWHNSHASCIIIILIFSVDFLLLAISLNLQHVCFFSMNFCQKPFIILREILSIDLLHVSILNTIFVRFKMQNVTDPWSIFTTFLLVSLLVYQSRLSCFFI